MTSRGARAPDGWTLPPPAPPAWRGAARARPSRPPTHLPVALEGEAELVGGGRGPSRARALGRVGGGGRLVVREGVGERPLLHLCLPAQVQLESLRHGLAHRRRAPSPRPGAARHGERAGTNLAPREPARRAGELGRQDRPRGARGSAAQSPRAALGAVPRRPLPARGPQSPSAATRTAGPEPRAWQRPRVAALGSSLAAEPLPLFSRENLTAARGTFPRGDPGEKRSLSFRPSAVRGPGSARPRTRHRSACSPAERGRCCPRPRLRQPQELQQLFV